MVCQNNFTYKFLQNTTVPIRIMETWTDLLRDKDYKDKFIKAIFNSIDNNNGTIEILLLDPESRDLIKARTKELKDTSSEFNNINIEENIYTNLYEIQEIKKQLEKRGKSDRLQLKFYNISPSIALYMCSPNLFVSFFRSGKLTTMGKQLKLPVNSPMARFYR